jgi:GNAT superfamily N-acetyltransferase
MIVRAASPDDLARLGRLVRADPACPLTMSDYRIRTAHGEYRPEWTWIAGQPASDGQHDDHDGHGQHDGHGSDGALAAGIWWGHPGQAAPETLDGLFARDDLPREDRPAVAAELIAAAHRAFAAAGGPVPDFHLMLPGDWRGKHDVVTALTWRWEAAARAGLTEELERLRFEWTKAAGLPASSGRLTFRAEPDDGVFVQIFRRVLDGSLDATTTKAASALGADTQARLDVAFYRDKMHGDRGWWRVAQTRDGQTVGFGVPSANSEVPVVGYLGVLPEHRGQGYIDDILAEITRILVTEAGADTIEADTDLANQPMAAAFERAGYRNFARRVVLHAP